MRRTRRVSCCILYGLVLGTSAAKRQSASASMVGMRWEVLRVVASRLDDERRSSGRAIGKSRYAPSV